MINIFWRLSPLFREINQALLKKTESDLNKRWFRDVDRNCDLFIWQNIDNEVVKFQFWHDEVLLEWDIGKGIKTGKMDVNTGAFMNYQAPIFRYHDNFNRDIILTIRSLINGIEGNNSQGNILDVIVTELERMSFRLRV